MSRQTPPRSEAPRQLLPVGAASTRDELVAAYEAQFRRRPPRLRLACRAAVVPTDAVAGFLGWLGGQDDPPPVSLGLLHLLELPDRDVDRLAAAGLSTLELSFPAWSAPRFDAVLERPGAFAETARRLTAIRGRHGNEAGDGRGRRWPGLEVDLRVPVDASAVAHGDELLAFLAALAPLGHRLAIELRPRRAAGGGVALPGFRDLRSLAQRIVATVGDGWRDGAASLGLVAASGLPACLFRDAPESLRFLRLPAPSPDAAAGPDAAPLCRSCALGGWCPVGRFDRAAVRRFAGWLADLEPFDAVPSVVHGPISPESAALPREGWGAEHVPRRDHVSYGRFLRTESDAFLWGGGRARRLLYRPEDIPAALPAAADFPVLITRIPGVPVPEAHSSTVLAPSGLIHLASTLHDRGYPVTVVDLIAEAARAGLQNPHDRPPREALVEFCTRRLEEARAAHGAWALAGFSAETEDALDIVGEVAAATGVAGYNVIGGRAFRARVSAGEVLGRHPVLDFAITGEGELPLLLLCNAVAERRAPRDVPGLAWRQGGYVAEQPSGTHELDAVAPPYLDWFDPALYPPDLVEIEKAFGDRPHVPYMFVRGCPFACAFCGDYSGGMYCAKDIDLVVRDLRHTVERYGIRDFLFLNTLVNLSPRYLKGFLAGIEESGLDITWSDSARAQALTPETLQRMRRAGCVMLSWGIEAASNRLSRLIDKRLDLDRAGDVLRWSHEAGITNCVNLIPGLPHETEADIEESIAWMRRNAPYIWRVRLSAYTFLDNSLFYLHPERYDLVRTEDGLGFDEKGGLTWDAKREEIADSMRRMEVEARELGLVFG